MAKREDIRKILIIGSGPIIIGPVSYTHLDVYKRQVYIRFLGAGHIDVVAVPVSGGLAVQGG